MTADLHRAARTAHARMLDAFDKLMADTLKREGPAMEAKLRAEGKTAQEAAEGARAHVERLLVEIARERARLEGEAVTRWQ